MRLKGSAVFPHILFSGYDFSCEAKQLGFIWKIRAWRTMGKCCRIFSVDMQECNVHIHVFWILEWV